MSGKTILLVEDEPQMRSLLRTALTPSGFRLVETSTGVEARAALAQDRPDLILLDLGLPDVDGLELTAAIRRSYATPIIVISARGREDDKVAALDAGANDYVTKPFGIRELLARMRVALRQATPANDASSYEVAGLRIDPSRREVHRDGTPVHLTPIEFKLLSLLARNAGKVLTHRQILDGVWGPDHTDPQHVRVHMAELRKKVEDNPARPTRILTELGGGDRRRDNGTGSTTRTSVSVTADFHLPCCPAAPRAKRSTGRTDGCWTRRSPLLARARSVCDCVVIVDGPRLASSELRGSYATTIRHDGDARVGERMCGGHGRRPGGGDDLERG